MKWKDFVVFNHLFANSDILNLLQRHSFKLSRYLLAIFIVSNVANAKIVNDLKIWEKINFPIKKEYKASTLDKVKKICGEVAFDMEWWKYVIKMPTSLYEKNEGKIMKDFPDNEWCTFVVATREEKKSPTTEVVYTWIVEDTDASDLVEKERKEAEQAEAEMERKKAEMNKQTYLSRLFDNVYYILKENLSNEEVIAKLKNIEQNLIVSYITDKSDRKSLKEGLETIEIKYQHNKQIKKYAKDILNRLKLD